MRRQGVAMPDIVGSILGKEKQHLRNAPSDDWILPDTTIGVEVELENVPYRTLGTSLPSIIQAYWEWHEDPSLHNSGAEFTFRNPIFGEDAKVALVELFRYAQKHRFEPSLRTGIHVHVDARDLSRYQLLGMLAYYTIFEPCLYAWVGDERHANNFCLPWFKFEGALDQTIDILRAMKHFSLDKHEKKSRENVLKLCEQFHRYAGLNLKSLATFGSIEFRQLMTTLDYGRVRDWINIIFGLKRAALQVPESTMVIIMDIRRRGVEAVARQIFGEEVAEEMWKLNPNLSDEIREHSLPNAIELIAGVLEDGEPGEAKPESMTWIASIKEKKDHPGFVAWRKKHYPKDLEPKEEKPPPKRPLFEKYLAMPGFQQMEAEYAQMAGGWANDASPDAGPQGRWAGVPVEVIEALGVGVPAESVTEWLSHGYRPRNIPIHIAVNIPLSLSEMGYKNGPGGWYWPGEEEEPAMPKPAIHVAAGVSEDADPQMLSRELRKGIRYLSIPSMLGPLIEFDLHAGGYRFVGTEWRYQGELNNDAAAVAPKPYIPYVDPPQAPQVAAAQLNKFFGDVNNKQEAQRLDRLLIRGGPKPNSIPLKVAKFMKQGMAKNGYKLDGAEGGIWRLQGELEQLIDDPEQDNQQGA